MKEARYAGQYGSGPTGGRGANITEIRCSTKDVGEVREGAGRQCHEYDRYGHQQHDVEWSPTVLDEPSPRKHPGHLSTVRPSIRS